MLDMWNPTADCTLLILHLEISLTNLEPLQSYFIFLNCICSVITITLTLTITIPFTQTTISTPEALIYMLLASFSSSPSPRPSQFTNSLHEALSQPSFLLLTVFKFKIVQINCDWFCATLNQFAYSSTSSWCKDSGIHWLLALDSLLCCFCSLHGRPLSNFFRSTPIHSLLGPVDSARRLHQDSLRTLGYIDY